MKIVRCLTVLVLVGVLFFSEMPRARTVAWTHSFGCGNSCLEGHDSTTCLSRPDRSECTEVECCNYTTFVYLAADNLDTADWSCPGDGTVVGLHTICPCGCLSSSYSDAWDPVECGSCGTRQWQDCVRDGRVVVWGNVPCHTRVDSGWCQSETGFPPRPCTPAGQRDSELVFCDLVG